MDSTARLIRLKEPSGAWSAGAKSISWENSCDRRRRMAAICRRSAEWMRYGIGGLIRQRDGCEDRVERIRGVDITEPFAGHQCGGANIDDRVVVQKRPVLITHA